MQSAPRSYESVATEGTATLTPVSATARVTATGLDLASYYPYLTGSLTAAVSGRLDLSGTLHHNLNRV